MNAFTRWLLLLALAALLWSPVAHADPVPSAAWEVAVLDGVLATLPPGERLATVGDMRLLAAPLRDWRNHLAGGRAPRSAFDGLAPIWPGGKVHYAFNNNVSPAKQRAFLDAAREWATFANLEFLARTTQANFILVAENPNLGGGQSAVGMVGGPQALEIGPYAWNRGTLVHEIGHALGLIHEHQRSDRDGFVTILTNNIAPGAEANFIRLPNSNNRSAYDFYSVMHYARNALSVEPATRNTILPQPAYSSFLDIMGGDNDTILSVADRAGVASIYGAGPPVTHRVTHTRDSGPGSLRAALYFAHDHPGTTVTFELPTTDPGFSNSVFNVRLTANLPTLARATILDGASQATNSNPTGPAILLNGEDAWLPGVWTYGLRLRGTNCVARRLALNGFSDVALLITGAQTTHNAVEGCYLGVTPDGLSAATNQTVLVLINGGARNNRLGGGTASARNVIGGSPYQGVVLADADTRDNVVAGNYIGLNAAGSAAVPNAWSGVALYGGAQSNLIGGFTTGARNVISGNQFQGLTLSGSGTRGNVVAGNFIGLDPTGTAARPNGWAGVDLFSGATENTIGGTNAASRNVISGNGFQGVALSGEGTEHNHIAGNVIGLNASGAAPLPNGWAGLDLWDGARANVLGPANVIAGNGGQGVALSGVGTTANLVGGNWIGLAANGTTAAPNGWCGLTIYAGATANVVGGSPEQRNVISGNAGQGVVLADEGTAENVIAGNFIGVAPSGSFAIPNGWSGVELFGGAADNLIGGGVGRRNIIAGNGNFGVLLSGAGTERNLIQGNTIGMDATGANPLPNAWAGVELYGGACSNQIGGVTLGSANLIAGNLGGGVLLFDADTRDNAIRGNSIHANAGAGIYLDGFANAALAAPLLTSAIVGTNTVVAGTLSGAPGTTFALEFFRTPSGSAAQGRTLVGVRTVTTTGAGTANFTAQLGATLPLGSLVTATATDPTGNTSAFSAAVLASGQDSVGDGIPDAWRAARFGGNGATTNAVSCATCDPDGDGLNNGQEFLAGTLPTSAASALRFSSIAASPAGVTLDFASVADVPYRLETRPSLTTGAWSVLADQIAGTGSVLQLLDPSARPPLTGFYRLRAQP